MHLPTTPTMPFTAAQLTSIWTNPAQMGLPVCTHTQMATEVLLTPDDFADLVIKSDLEALFRLFLKPAKVTIGPVAAGALHELQLSSFLLS